MTISPATNQRAWDEYVNRQRYSPFLQSWATGEVYREIGQEPIRLEMREGNELVGVCFGHVVDAKRGRHLSIPYGPVLAEKNQNLESRIQALMEELKRIAKDSKCSFIRMSPFWPAQDQEVLRRIGMNPSPLHLLAETIWYLPLKTPDPWESNQGNNQPIAAEELFKAMRSTTRNLIRRAEKEGVEIRASESPERDIEHFLTLHEETRKRHGFTAYTNAFFRAQVKHFAKNNECTLYLAYYKNEVIASSVHMHFGGETSYHHGASTQKYRNIPASYLLQWTAIQDALKRGDHVYNFWGIAPMSDQQFSKKHPFAGVTLFKTGFGGKKLDLVHCSDIPVSKKYYITRGFEMIRKWKRGF